VTLVNELERFFRYATQQTSHEITLDRPALKRLLDDSAAGLIDTVVVYKVDRLTRSLTDFARIMTFLIRSA